MASMSFFASIIPPLSVRTVSQKPRLSAGRELISSGAILRHSLAKFSSVVTRYAEESGPCSASISKSVTANVGETESSAYTMASLGPASGPVSISVDKAFFAASTYPDPGPTILSTLGMVCVPYARAAIA